MSDKTAGGSSAAATTNAAAVAFKALHRPGNPVLLANVYDATSARVVGSLPGCVALATASFAVARARGTEDEKLTLSTQLQVVAEIAAVASTELAGRPPLTVDLQDGYGEELEDAITTMVELGVVGVNLEDSDRATGKVMDEHVAVDRVRRAVAAAAAAGAPDFVVNARSDTFFKGEGTLEESVRRGRLYLEAGAACVFVLGGGPHGLDRDQVRTMVAGLDGRVNVALRLPKPGSEGKVLSTAELAELGVSRVSVGPQVYFAAVEAMKKAATTVFGAEI